METAGHSVFVSYVYAEAKSYASKTKELFEANGYQAWVWHHDHSPLGYTKREMSDRIFDCEYFLHICTKGSQGSGGQQYEREMARNHDKMPPILLAFDKSYVPEEWRDYDFIYNEVSPSTFAKVCVQVAKDLKNQPRVENRVVVTAESQQIEQA